jgi:hypothetical protein
MPERRPFLIGKSPGCEGIDVSEKARKAHVLYGRSAWPGSSIFWRSIRRTFPFAAPMGAVQFLRHKIHSSTNWIN